MLNTTYKNSLKFYAEHYATEAFSNGIWQLCSMEEENCITNL